VHQLRGARRGAAREIALLDECSREAAGDGIEGRAGADDAGTDHEHVELTGRHGVERLRA
jgi:hypothetical protein